MGGGGAEADPDGVLELFNAVDEDGSGALDGDELANLCNRLGIAMSADDIAAALEEMDGDGDGTADFAEFAHWYKQGASDGHRDLARALEARKDAIDRSNRGLRNDRGLGNPAARRAARKPTIAERAAMEAKSTNAMRARGASTAPRDG